MFIPIGLEQTTVRRLPWVSIAIIALNLAAFLLVGTSADTVAEEAGRRAQEVVQYWTKHPYLKLPEEVLPPGMSQAEREKLTLMVEAMRSAPGQSVPDAEQREREEKELEALVTSLREGIAEHPTKSWGLVPSDPKPLAFLSSMFMHAGWLHLLGNMLFFYVSGPFLEDAFGRPLFAGLYLASGIVAALVHIVSFPNSDAPLVGASGAIAGIMGAFLVRFVRTKIRFFYFYFVGLFRTGTVDLPAWVVLPLWFLEQVFFAGLAGSSGVAYRAHIGGFVFGFLAAVAIKQLRIEEKYIAPKIEGQISVTQHPALEEGMDLLVRGETAAARKSFEKMLAEEPRNADAHLAMWQSHCHDGNPDDGADHLVHAIEEEIRRGDLNLALDHWRELTATAHRSGPAALRWRLAGSLAPADSEAAAEILRNLASDAGAGVLAEKALRQLAAMGETALAPPAAKAAAPSAQAPGPTAGTTQPVRAPAWPLPPAAAGPAAPPLVAADEPVAAPPPPPAFWKPVEPSPAGPPDPNARPEIEACQVEELQTEGLLVRGLQGGSDLLPFADVEKVVVAGITARPKPFLVLDLVLARVGGEPRRVERLLSTEFDPRILAGRPDLNGLAAFREVVRVIAVGADAQVVPQELLVPSTPIPMFESIEAYERVALFPQC
ncbi:MAG TPA: rhomboid family intramembrane serine protease [Thermoanaerobaculaceae bacterium]|nr:rhomboid family intramembrane serine protease [Thermoanaerobaculaceae bacterium]